jgi:hypothetical protein
MENIANNIFETILLYDLLTYQSFFKFYYFRDYCQMNIYDDNIDFNQIDELINYIKYIIKSDNLIINVSHDEEAIIIQFKNNDMKNIIEGIEKL